MASITEQEVPEKQPGQRTSCKAQNFVLLCIKLSSESVEYQLGFV